MNKLSTADRVRVISALVEGCSIRSTVRMTGVAKNTIVKLLAEIGEACKACHDDHVCHLLTKRVQCDEIWAFIYAKQRNVPEPLKGEFGYGDVWTWTAIDADSKLIISYMVGLRDAGYAHEFMRDVASRLARKVQLTTDGLRVYLDAVDDAFGGDIDYAQLIKVYGPDKSSPGRYSPPEVVSVTHEDICGTPDIGSVSTSYVERQNLTMRMSMRRFTRLTNAFSKKVENHEAMVALHFMHYNYCRVHQTLRVTPAMQAGLTDHVWEIEELVGLIG
jgi:IS1 family transposase